MLLLLLASLFALPAGLLSQAPYGLEERMPNTRFLPGTAGYELGEMQLRQVFAGAYLGSPVFLTHAGDGSDRIFVCDRAGRVRVFPNRHDVSGAADFLDLRDRVNDGPGEGGLLGLAFHPLYADNGRLFVFYTHGAFYTRVSEFAVSGENINSADPATERVILDLRQPASNHNGGMIGFGPDGFLYVGLGDGGGAGDRFRNGQDPSTLLGAILRIDVDSRVAELPYAVPPDNPFYDRGSEWRPEIWAYGLRNPWRFSFDRLTGDLWAGDVGQGAWEEIDLIARGGNYGWNRMEGFHCYPASSDCQTEGLELPVVEYDHSVGRSVTGGYVYRGSRLPRLYGAYVYGDFTFRTIWALRYEDGQVVDQRTIARSPALISSFGEDEAGELYVVGIEGGIYIFDDPTGTPQARLPETISASGLYTDPARRDLSPGVIPYSVNSQLWSDGAHKERYLALPGLEQVTFSSRGHWQFPAGTAFVKSFYLDMESGNPASRRIVETRFLIKRRDDAGWDGFSYEWNAGGTDAVLLEGSASRTFTIADAEAPGGEFVYDYYFPNRAQCDLCHTPAAGYVLGVNTGQLNRAREYGAVRDHQLRALNHIGLFSEDIGEDYSALPRLPDPLDATRPLASRARSYLDANCANCHRPGGTGRVEMDLRFEQPDDETGLIDVPAVLTAAGAADGVRLRPGSPNTSALLQRMLNTGDLRMPPLATSRVDRQGAGLIEAWIRGLGTPTAIAGTGGGQPRDLHLAQNYPNPYNSSTVITVSLPRDAHVNLEVHDLLGQCVAVLTRGPRPAGTHHLTFDSRGLASGVYVYRLEAGGRVLTRRMMHLK